MDHHHHFGSVYTEALGRRYTYVFLYGMGELSVPVRDGRGLCLRVLVTALGLETVQDEVCTVEDYARQLGGPGKLTEALDRAPSFLGAVGDGMEVELLAGQLPEENHVRLVPSNGERTDGKMREVGEVYLWKNTEYMSLREFFSPESPWWSRELHSSTPQSTSRAADALESYRRYLESNYVGGVSRFFSPTGFLQEFQVSVQLKAAEARRALTVSSLNDACGHLSDAVAGKPGVYDIAMAPGTGKTTGLAFRFPDSKVVVAMPTPLDAWSAFMSASASARLDLQGLQLGSPDCSVVYTDSYMAAYKILSGQVDFQVLLVDECNSRRGLSSFLSSVKVEGVTLVRMSGSFGSERLFSGSFGLDIHETLPDYSDLARFKDFVVSNSYGRSLVIMPSSEEASLLYRMIPGSVLVADGCSFGDLAAGFLDQASDKVYISDESCSRGTNLNLDAVFDTQYVKTDNSVRVVTSEELMQRKHRLARNRRGTYFCTGAVEPADLDYDPFDLVRSNVVLSLCGLAQQGPKVYHVDPGVAASLLCSPVEPLGRLSAGGSGCCSEPAVYESMSSAVSVSSCSSPKSHGSPKLPGWALWLSGTWSTGRGPSVADYQVAARGGGSVVVSRKSSRSSSGSASGESRGGGVGSVRSVARFSGAALVESPVVRQAPRPTAPSPPPTVDLGEGGSALRWPALLRDAVQSGSALPPMRPAGGFVHTRASGMDTDWPRRLDEVSRGPVFSDVEFETVVRAWNWLCARSWLSAAPVPVGGEDLQRVEFCLGYFQSFYLLRSS